jgi:hypothetical protein
VVPSGLTEKAVDRRRVRIPWGRGPNGQCSRSEGSWRPGIVKATGLDENARREPGARPEEPLRVRFTLLSRVL